MGSMRGQSRNSPYFKDRRDHIKRWEPAEKDTRRFATSKILAYLNDIYKESLKNMEALEKTWMGFGFFYPLTFGKFTIKLSEFNQLFIESEDLKSPEKPWDCRFCSLMIQKMMREHKELTDLLKSLEAVSGKKMDFKIDGISYTTKKGARQNAAVAILGGDNHLIDPTMWFRRILVKKCSQLKEMDYDSNHIGKKYYIIPMDMIGGIMISARQSEREIIESYLSGGPILNEAASIFKTRNKRVPEYVFTLSGLGQDSDKYKDFFFEDALIYDIEKTKAMLAPIAKSDFLGRIQGEAYSAVGNTIISGLENGGCLRIITRGDKKRELVNEVENKAMNTLLRFLYELKPVGELPKETPEEIRPQPRKELEETDRMLAEVADMAPD